MAPFLENCLGTDLVLLIEGCKFAFKSCVHPKAMSCQPDDIWCTYNKHYFSRQIRNPPTEDGWFSGNHSNSLKLRLFGKLFKNRPRPHSWGFRICFKKLCLSLVHAVSHDLKLKGRVLVISKRGICESGFGVFFLQKLRFSALCRPNQQKFGTLWTLPKVIITPKIFPNLSTDGLESTHTKSH